MINFVCHLRRTRCTNMIQTEMHENDDFERIESNYENSETGMKQMHDHNAIGNTLADSGLVQHNLDGTPEGPDRLRLADFVNKPTGANKRNYNEMMSSQNNAPPPTKWEKISASMNISIIFLKWSSDEEGEMCHIPPSLLLRLPLHPIESSKLELTTAPENNIISFKIQFGEMLTTEKEFDSKLALQGNSSSNDMALESCQGGELFDQITRKGRFYSAQVVDALEYIHNMGLIHRDIKHKANASQPNHSASYLMQLLPVLKLMTNADDKACTFVGTVAYFPRSKLLSSNFRVRGNENLQITMEVTAVSCLERSTMMKDLPGDLLEEILCRVPAKSLKKVRSTCKRWDNICRSGRFTRKHFRIAAKEFLILMLNEFRVCSVSVNLHGVPPSVEITGYASQEFAIHEINSNDSNSWRIIDATRKCHVNHTDYGVSLKGNTYWFASDEEQEQLGVFLLSFDYTTERFRRQCLPYQCPIFEIVSLSVIRDEKLSVLLQRESRSNIEIWLTNKIGETKVVSWSMLLLFTLDVPSEFYIWNGISFLVDEEKKVIVCCDKFMVTELDGKNLVYIIGEDNKVTQVDFGLVECWPFLFNYVPSMTQIHQGLLGGKRKRDE
ncbi:unnamed protein product [Arabidopsis halleri]